MGLKFYLYVHKLQNTGSFSRHKELEGWNPPKKGNFYRQKLKKKKGKVGRG